MRVCVRVYVCGFMCQCVVFVYVCVRIYLCACMCACMCACVLSLCVLIVCEYGWVGTCMGVFCGWVGGWVRALMCVCGFINHSEN